jgi:lipopolysaccharide export system protein LptC
MPPRLRILLVLVMVLAAVVSWRLVQEEKPPSQGITKSGPREIDYYVTGLDVTRMTTAGRPAHRLRAVNLQHYTDDDTTELQQPRLTVYQADGPPWEVDAERAWMSADGSLVLLSGEVLIEREGDVSNRPMRIVTRDLRVQPSEDYAETDEKVRVESESDWLDAVGMQAWLRPPSRLKFLSQVKGYYVPR